MCNAKRSQSKQRLNGPNFPLCSISNGKRRNAGRKKKEPRRTKTKNKINKKCRLSFDATPLLSYINKGLKAHVCVQDSAANLRNPIGYFIAKAMLLVG
jgi:hypothetical protein